MRQVESHHLTEDGILDSKTRMFLMVVRQALIMVLGALEEYIGMERTIIPRHKR